MEGQMKRKLTEGEQYAAQAHMAALAFIKEDKEKQVVRLLKEIAGLEKQYEKVSHKVLHGWERLTK